MIKFVSIIIFIVLNGKYIHAQKDSSLLKKRMSLNLMIIPNYVNSFNDEILFHTKDNSRNIGKGIRVGTVAECKLTTRKTLRLGIYHYNEESNFELFQDNISMPFPYDNAYGTSYFYKEKQSGIEFPVEYKYIFINKYSRIKMYVISGLILSYYYKRQGIILNNGSPLFTDGVTTTYQFKHSDFFRIVVRPGIKYEGRKKISVFVEPGYGSPGRYFSYGFFTGYGRFHYWFMVFGVNYKI